MKKIIITGASGFIGANLVHKSLALGHQVHLFVRPEFKDWRLSGILSDVHLHTLSLEDPVALNKALKSILPDWIFHTAVHGAYSSQTNLLEMVHTNIIGTMQLVTAASQIGFEAFINTGSSSEYGYKDHAPSEKDWIEPNSHYAVTKACATQFCRSTAEKEKLFIPTLRLYSVYGPYEEPTRLMPTLITKGLQGKLPPLVDPTIARDYVYVDDVVDAYFQTAQTKNQEFGAVYNVGTSKQTTLLQLVKTVSSLLPIQEKPEWGSMPNRSWDTSCWVADTNLIRKTLKWKPKYTLKTGLQKMIEWQKQHLEHAQ
jgi:nucleoside-diphosphate-sugar epimerase